MMINKGSPTVMDGFFVQDSFRSLIRTTGDVRGLGLQPIAPHWQF